MSVLTYPLSMFVKYIIMDKDKYIKALHECHTLNVIFQLTDKCVMSCKYCFAKGTNDGKASTFSDEVLEKVIKQSFETQHSYVTFEFTGGEAFLVGVDFYKKVIQYQKKYANKGYDNCIQTSCYYMDEELVDFLIENNFGISTTIDGTREIHNQNRPANGDKKSYNTIIQNREQIISKGQSCGFITTVTKNNIGHEREILESFRKLGCHAFHSNPYIYFSKNKVKDLSIALSGDDWARYLINEFNVWFDEGKVSPIPLTVDYMLQCLVSKRPSHNTICTYGGRCLTNFIAIIPNGDAYTCPKFTGSENMKLGNINDTSITEMLSVEYPKMQDLINQRLQAFKKCEEKDCKYGYICNGGCPYHSFIASDGENIAAQDCLCDAKIKVLDYINDVKDHILSVCNTDNKSL